MIKLISSHVTCFRVEKSGGRIIEGFACKEDKPQSGIRLDADCYYFICQLCPWGDEGTTKFELSFFIYDSNSHTGVCSAFPLS